MFKGMGLSGKLYLGFAAVLAIAGALGIFAYTRLVQINADAKVITANCLPGVFKAEEIQKGAQENLILVARHILAKDKADMDAIETEIGKVKTHLDKLQEDYEGTIIQAKDRELFAKVAPARTRFVAVRNQSVLPPSRIG
jgi:hypothetical protein